MRGFEPLADDVTIADARLGAGGRIAFLTLCRRQERPWFEDRGAQRAAGVVLDLSTGAWRLAPPFDVFEETISPAHALFAVGARQAVALHPLVFSRGSGDPWHWLRGTDPAAMPVTVWDGRTGQVLHRHVHSVLEGELPLLLEERRATSPLRLPDGRRVWVRNGDLEVGEHTGPVTKLPWERGWFAQWPAGFGFWTTRPSAQPPERSLYDLVRERRFDVGASAALQPLGLRTQSDLLVLPRGWLVRDRRSGGERGWLCFDPATGELTPPNGLAAGDAIGGVIDDGRVIAGSRSTGMQLVDRWTGARTALRWEDGAPVPSADTGFGGRWPPTARGCSGRRDRVRMAIRCSPAWTPVQASCA